MNIFPAIRMGERVRHRDTGVTGVIEGGAALFPRSSQGLGLKHLYVRRDDTKTLFKAQWSELERIEPDPSFHGTGV